MAFLEKINSLNGYSCYDWQVTVCFYVGVHLVNAHLATFNHHFGDHSKVSHALNPKISKVAGSIDKDPFYAYKSLRNLSRLSRYLVHSKNPQQNPDKVHHTYDRHLAKALRHMNSLIVYFKDKYSLDIDPITVNCVGIKNKELEYVLQD